MSSERLSRMRERLPAFLAGASAGLLMAWLLARTRPDPAPAPSPAPVAQGDAPRPPWRWAETWDDALDTLVSARERLLGPADVDLEALALALAELPGAGELEVRALGEGIVELVGQAPGTDDVQRALDTLSQAPGVQVVVNRAWTPSSLDANGN